MNLSDHYKSLTRELDSLKDRVRNYIEDNHWLTDGEWREAVLRSMIEKRLPDHVKIGRGFIMTKDGPSTQCDILLYRFDAPPLFRDSDLVLLTPDAVLGIVEVKSKIGRTGFRKATRKLSKVKEGLGDFAKEVCVGLFSFDVRSSPIPWFKEDLPVLCNNLNSKVDLFNVGCSTFVKWWDKSPFDDVEDYFRWHSYVLENMSAGYFITNLVDAVCDGRISKNQNFFFPEEGKENYRQDIIAMCR